MKVFPHIHTQRIETSSVGWFVYVWRFQLLVHTDQPTTFAMTSIKCVCFVFNTSCFLRNCLFCSILFVLYLSENTINKVYQKSRKVVKYIMLRQLNVRQNHFSCIKWPEWMHLMGIKIGQIFPKLNIDKSLYVLSESILAMFHWTFKWFKSHYAPSLWKHVSLFPS